MSRFQVANDIAILFGARKLSWTEQTPTDVPPTAGSPAGGVPLEKDAVRVMLAIKPDSGAGPATVRVHGWIAALGDWFELTQVGETIGEVPETGYAERFAFAGFQRIYVQTDVGANITIAVGQSVLE